MAGALTYRRLLVGALLMAKRFADLPGTNVGLLLPASVGCDMALLALHLAGKLPVVLNWTTGPANLAHAAEVMKLRHVVTSKAFVDRTGIEVTGGAISLSRTDRSGYRQVGEADRAVASHALSWRCAPAGAAGRSGAAGGGAVHQRFGEGAQGGAADAQKHHQRSAFRYSGDGAAARRCLPWIPAGLPQLRPDGDGTAAAAGRHACGASPRPDRRHQPGPQDRRLQTHHSRSARRRSFTTSSNAASRANCRPCG